MFVCSVDLNFNYSVIYALFGLGRVQNFQIRLDVYFHVTSPNPF